MALLTVAGTVNLTRVPSAGAAPGDETTRTALGDLSDRAARTPQRSSGAPDYLYAVRPTAMAHDVPGSEITFTAAEDAASYLWTEGLEISAVDQLGLGDNIGNTARIRCDGPGLIDTGVRGSYWATNMVPPTETALTPVLRWLFIAPQDGDYTCRISMASYSTIIKDGREVSMRLAAGARLTRAVYANAARWGLYGGANELVKAGQTKVTLRSTFLPTVAAADQIVVVQDAALTTCKANSSIKGCAGGVSRNPGTTVRSWIEAQPKHADGSDCGRSWRGEQRQQTFSSAKHHAHSTSLIRFAESKLAGCAGVRLSLSLQHVSGNPFVLHRTFFEGIVGSHGVALEMTPEQLRVHDHAGGDGAIAGLIDENESTGRAVAPVLVG
ncbi:hypothetical protein [Pilimelia columellifera]|uniref:Uncharacterized protein n=1 Tax=Pilimelia columellifera subsp. columellifera TaxID=706583 RepID=A0ABN3NB59_9ACTN